MIKKEMVPEHYDDPSENGYLKFNEAMAQKIYPNTIHNGKALNVKIAAHLLPKILGTTVTVSVFTDSGSHPTTYQVEELFKVRPSGITYGDMQPLNKDLFI